MQTVCERTLEEISHEILAQASTQPALEYAGKTWKWDELRRFAEYVGQLVTAAAPSAGAHIALMARSRPSAIAALLGLFGTSRSIYMIHVYQSAAGIIRDMDKIKACGHRGGSRGPL